MNSGNPLELFNELNPRNKPSMPNRHGFTESGGPHGKSTNMTIARTVRKRFIPLHDFFYDFCFPCVSDWFVVGHCADDWPTLFNAFWPESTDPGQPRQQQQTARVAHFLWRGLCPKRGSVAGVLPKRGGLLNG
jgi:hypothetical protein